MGDFKHGLTGYTKHKCRCDTCRTAKSEAHRRYYEKNRDKVLRGNKEYRETHLDEWKEYRKRWGAQNRDKVNAYCQSYRERNPERYRRMALDRRHRRLASERVAGGEHSHTQFEFLKAVHGYRCVRCGKHESSAGSLSRDHIIPVSLGGSNDISNIQPMCLSCNSSKGCREAIDYRIGDFDELSKSYHWIYEQLGEL